MVGRASHRRDGSAELTGHSGRAHARPFFEKEVS